MIYREYFNNKISKLHHDVLYYDIVSKIKKKYDNNLKNYYVSCNHSKYFILSVFNKTMLKIEISQPINVNFKNNDVFNTMTNHDFFKKLYS